MINFASLNAALHPNRPSRSASPTPPLSPPLSGFDFQRVTDGVRREARLIGRAFQSTFEQLFTPPSRRPLGRFCNDLLGTHIKHNSVADIVLHHLFVMTCAAVMGGIIGAAFALTPPVVGLINLSITLAWHLTDEDNVFNL